MNIKSTLLIVSIFLCSNILIAQNTVGLTEYLPLETSNGYTLIFPHNQGNVYLLNNCGELVNVWTDSVYRPGNGVYLHNDGHLYVCKGRGQASNSYIHAGGGGEKVEKRDWNNNLVWEYFVNDSMQRMHHDIAVLPNGNVLIIAWERHLGPEALMNGRDPAFMPDGEVWAEKIIEVEPVGASGGNIVWQWSAWDHLIQDHDNTRLNFGVVANSPELINLNYGSEEDDWIHMNGIAYNSDLDQIMLSAPDFDEIWIIDHSTTTAQAASSSGGLSGLGGDLMYRWGNPEAYDNGDSTNQKVFFSHNCHWIDEGLNSSHPDYGKILFFNNRFATDHSAVNIISPIFDTYDWEYTKSGAVWGPTNYSWTYTAPTPSDLYSTGLSSAQRLQNGNTLICEGRDGRIFEIDDMSNIVWEFEVPFIGGNPVSQGTTVPFGGNITFMATKYRPSHPAFTGQNLNGIGYMELNPDTSVCNTILSIEEGMTNDSQISIYPNPATNDITFDFSAASKSPDLVEIFDAFGKRIHYRDNIAVAKIKLDISFWPSGVYHLRINSQYNKKFVITH